MIARLIGLGVPRALAADFPLTPHLATKRWCKKLPTPAGPKICYFGPLADWQAALNRYDDEKADLIKGRAPSARGEGLSLRELLNNFLHVKRGLVDTGELTMQSWYDYHRTAQRMEKVLGRDSIVSKLAPADFERLRADYARTLGAVSIAGEINRVQIIFKHAHENGLLDAKVKCGPTFKRPRRQTLRKVRAQDRQQHGPRMFTADELRVIIDGAKQPMKSMILLAMNGGFNNMDVATIPTQAIDLQRGIADFPRKKTGIPRLIPLWPETVASIEEWLADRPTPKHAEDDHLLFLTGHRRAWHRLGRFVEAEDGKTVVRGIDNPVSRVFRELLVKVEIPGSKRGFSALRHGFRTIGRGARDREAIDALMGHSDHSMAGHYLEDGLPLERLRAVTDHIRLWLFPQEQERPRLRIAAEGETAASA